MDFFRNNLTKVINAPGGVLCEVFGDKENAHASVGLVRMHAGGCVIKHYHDIITEIYVFAEGEG